MFRDLTPSRVLLTLPLLKCCQHLNLNTESVQVLPKQGAGISHQGHASARTPLPGNHSMTSQITMSHDNFNIPGEAGALTLIE